MKRNLLRLCVLVLAASLLLTACSAKTVETARTDNWSSNYKYVFVHGLARQIQLPKQKRDCIAVP